MDGIGPETYIGSACLLMGDAGLILEVQKPHKWRQRDDGHLAIGLGCIGGTVEEGEGPVEALQREAEEEIGCHIELRSAGNTWEVDPKGGARKRAWSLGGPRPILLWQGRGPGYVEDAKVAVYLGRPGGQPKPRDLPAIVTVGLRKVLDLSWQPQSVAEMVAGGAELQQREAIPPSALLTLEGTLGVLAGMQGAHRGVCDRILAEVEGMEEI